jgi:uncharacterized protein
MSEFSTDNTDRGSGWFITYSGIRFWPLDPRPEDICITDIAHSLSHICRFGGHARHFYSVAQHSVIVSHLVEPELALAGLMHDATEAYLGDMTRPLKHQMPEYQRVEGLLWRVIAEKFGLPSELPPSIKHADNVALLTERRDVINPAKEPRPWFLDSLGIEPHHEYIFPLAAWDAKLLFNERYKELTDAKL